MQAYRQTCHKHSYTLSVIVKGKYGNFFLENKVLLRLNELLSWLYLKHFQYPLINEVRLLNIFLDLLVIQYNDGPHILSVLLL